MLSDEELMIELNNKNVEVYDELYHRWAQTLYQFIYLYVQEKGMTEDILQEAFIRVYTKRHQFDSQKALFKTWLHRIAYRLCIDYYRKHSKYTSVNLEQSQHLLESPGAEKKAVNNIFVEHLLCTLPKEEQAIVILTFYQDFSTKEIAHILKKPEGTIKSKRHYIFKKLNKQFIEGADYYA